MSSYSTHSVDLPCDVILCFLTRLPIPALLAFATASPVAYALVRHELRARHRRMLRRFVADPDAFLAVLNRAEGIISGSFALNYAHGEGSWAASDLDLYVNPLNFQDLIAYLVSHEAYTAYTRPDSRQRKLNNLDKRVR